jgi:hypothetical protein
VSDERPSNGAGDGCFEILRQSTAAAEPCESSFDDPSARQNFEALCRVGALDDFDYFICRHCGARYLVRYTELPIADSGSVYCDVCRRQITLLLHRPDPALRIGIQVRAARWHAGACRLASRAASGRWVTGPARLSLEPIGCRIPGRNLDPGIAVLLVGAAKWRLWARGRWS